MMVVIAVIMSPLRDLGRSLGFGFSYHHVTPTGFGRSVGFVYPYRNVIPAGVEKDRWDSDFPIITSPLRGLV